MTLPTGSTGFHTDPLYLSALASLGGEVAAPLTAVPPNNSIAILPFVNMSGDPGQDHFTDGLTEDIITDLSNVPGFFVIARNSTFAYKGKPADVRQIAYDLGVKYILEGSARRSDTRLRINVQLINAAEGGNHVWAERFDRQFADIFAVQDDVTAHIVKTVTGKLAAGARTERYRTSNLEAYDLCVRSRNLWTQSARANSDALSYLQRALQLDPNYAEAHWRNGLSQLFAWIHYDGDPAEFRTKAIESTRRAIAIDPNDSSAQWAYGFVIVYERLWEQARRQFQKSLVMNPNDADAHSIYSDFLFLDGKPQQALQSAAMALRLNPHPPGWHIWLLGQAQIACGQYTEAIQTLKREETYRSPSNRILAVALALSGRHDEARIEARAHLDSNPTWRYRFWIETRPLQKPEDVEFWCNAYRLAGFPE